MPVDICNHALLVGFGRVGSLLGEKLMAQGIPLVVVETSRTRVDELRERGISAVLGNAANEDHGAGASGLRPLAAADNP